MFDKVLVANRGEIAVRVIRALRTLGIPSIAVYSDADADALHVSLADEAYAIGPGPANESYLRGEAVLSACRASGADAVHPGYGFLAENAVFAAACADAGVVFVGPAPDTIAAMGEKTAARRTVAALGVPIVPGTTEPVASAADVLDVAAEIGYPVALKAAAGGGGLGFRVAHSADDLRAAFEAVRGEGARFFGSGEVYVERYFHDPRHVEVQVLGDAYGNVIHLGERDCTIQRRHQKLVEETPAPTVSAELRDVISAHALTVARAVDYRSAGTIEGLVVGDEFFFLEMNTRLQVEHPVTEAVTGVDLVCEQLRVAAGETLTISQQDVVPAGVALECRINAESAHKHFAPSPGTITAYREPEGVRVDTGVRAGSSVPVFYDSLLAKVVVHADSRETATARMTEALDGFTIEGVSTLISFHRALLGSEQWAAAKTARDLISDRAWLHATGH